MTDKPNGSQPTPPMPRASNLQQAMRNADQPPVSAETTEAIASILAQAEAQAMRVVRLGEYARDHGDYIAEKCGEYARMARTNAQNFASELLASEGRRRDEIAKLIGKK
jgi:hypothetical protein